MRIWVHIRRAATSKGLAECLESVFTRRRSHTDCSALNAATAKMLYRAVTGACGLETRTDQCAGGERFCTTDDGWSAGSDGAAESLPADLKSNVFVRDHERALKFYTEQLGFSVLA